MSREQYCVGWNDTMNALDDLLSRGEPTGEYLQKIKGIAEARTKEKGTRLKPYMRGVIAACDHYEYVGDTDKKEYQ